MPAAAPPILEAVISLEAVHRRFGSVQAVAGLDLCIGAGESFALVGPSGCGKTTTLRLIAGFDQPDSGRVLLEGRDVTPLPPHRRNVNTVFQNYALFPHLSVWDNVAFGPRSQGLAAAELRRRVGAMLETVQLSAQARRLPRQLSGGQQQRVALARALVNNPAALLLDEPLAALEPSLRQTLQQELRRLQQQLGSSFLVITHDREEALGLGDRIGVMRAGRLEQVGPPRQLYDHPATAFVATFLGEANLLRAGRDQPIRVVRPEALRLAAQPPGDGETGLAVRVVAVLYQGPTLRVELEAEDGLRLQARQLSSAAEPPVRSGDRCWALWRPDSCHPLP
ncbi:MAG: ABC transporter ATP-binding protein [Synechococcaceae cyanobacterium]|nr:ABC transporter ATP-binding protein [Synechococcaceae cyanobacterium]